MLYSVRIRIAVRRPEFGETSSILRESVPAYRLDLRDVYTYLYFERLVHTAMIYDSH